LGFVYIAQCIDGGDYDDDDDDDNNNNEIHHGTGLHLAVRNHSAGLETAYICRTQRITFVHKRLVLVFLLSIYESRSKFVLEFSERAISILSSRLRMCPESPCTKGI
jgi:hypothetical protein